jgi:hypothetical protein
VDGFYVVQNRYEAGRLLASKLSYLANPVRPGRAGGEDWLLGVLNQERLERAIGVIYLPESERISHYFHARLADQFDAVIHLDKTRAVEPLERTS